MLFIKVRFEFAYHGLVHNIIFIFYIFLFLVIFNIAKPKEKGILVILDVARPQKEVNNGWAFSDPIFSHNKLYV